ncbi:MAG: pilin [Patescibacteria group bacterium]
MKKIFIYSLIILAFSAQVVNAQAKNEYTLLEPLPAVDGSGKVMDKIDLNTYIEYVFKFSIALAVFLAVIMIIWGGFEYMLSEIPFIKTNAKSRITNAIMGLLGALVSYLILVTIDPRLVQINTTIDPICPPNSSGSTSTTTKGHLCNSDEVAAFRKSWLKDIKRLNTEDIAKMQTLDREVTELSRSIKDLEGMEKNVGLNPEDKVRLAALKKDLLAKETEAIRIESSGTGSIAFTTIVDQLNQPPNYVDDFELGNLVGRTSKTFSLNTNVRTDINNKIKEIEEKYLGKDGYVDQLTKKGDLEGAQALKGRISFYKEQIKEQEDLVSDIISYQKFSGQEKIKYGNSLKASLNTYSKPETLPEGYKKTDTVLYNDYEKIKKQRITMIQSVLTPTQAKP